MPKPWILAALAVLTPLAGLAQPFVQAQNGALVLNGAPFRFGGANSYVLMFSPNATLDQILGTVQGAHLTVVRMWAADDIGTPSSSDSFYLQYWNGSAPAYNDGANGLANVDYAVAKAGQLGIKLIIPFVNNWPDYGGMDQYLNWLGRPYHDQFYTDSTIRQWYKHWIAHMLNHVNSITGVAYKDDPTIMAWELANEPRCQGSGLPTSGSCTTQTIVSWIADVAPYIKSIDANHLVSVGDEGFFCVPGSSDYIDDCSSGVDNVAFAGTAGVDLLGFHLYPESWGQTLAWADTYILQHLTDAASLGKPAYMGEYGYAEGDTRNAVYQEWTDLILNNGGSGALFWDILGGTPSALGAESSDGFDLFAGSPIFTTVGNFGQMMSSNSAPSFAPVAGDQWATTASNAAATLSPLQNDIAYAGATVDPASIDLDPVTPGQQTSVSVYGGTFSVAGQSVQFTPAGGFNGTAQGAYTVADSNHQTSNAGYLFVTVAAAAGDWSMMESFEGGTDGWAPLNPAAGAISQSSTFHPDGNFGLQVDVTAGGWFGVTFPTPLNLSGRPSISLDIETTAAGGTGEIAFQSGSNYDWCQTSNGAALPTYSVTTLTIPLDASKISCYRGVPDLTTVRSLFVNLSGPGTYYLDNLRAAPQTSTTPLPTIGGVANSAGGQIGVAANAYIAIYGSNFAPADSGVVTWGNWFDNGKLPINVAGVTVNIGGKPAYVEAVTPNQINVLAPDAGTGNVQVTVTTSAGTSQPFTVPAQPILPAFFTWGSYAVATHLDYSLAVKPGTFGVPTVAAKPGEYVIFWGTGFGPTNPPVPDGQVVPAAAFNIDGVTATLGGVPVTVVGTAMAPGLAGVYQVAIQVPSGMANGDYPVVASLNGVQTPAGINLSVQQ